MDAGAIEMRWPWTSTTRQTPPEVREAEHRAEIVSSQVASLTANLERVYDETIDLVTEWAAARGIQ